MGNRKKRRQVRENKKKQQQKLRRIYALTSVVAFCSIVYQLLLAHTISLIAGNAIVWYSITIGVFLGSLGLGAIWSGKVKSEKVIQKLFLVELLLATVGGLAVSLMHIVQLVDMYFLAHGQAKLAFGFVLLGSQLIVATIGILSGFELPMLISIANSYSKEKKVTNRVLGIDYFGSLLGAVLFPLCLMVAFPVITIGFLVAIINILAALYLLKIFLPKTAKGNHKRFITGILLGIFLVIGIFKAAQLEGYFAKRYYYYPQALAEFGRIFTPMTEAPEIESYRSAYQKIDLVEEQAFSAANIMMDAYTDKLTFEPDFPLGKELYLNGDWQFNSGTEEIYHEYFAHVPILATDFVPKKVLVLGGGDGLLTRELLKYQELEKIVQVELDPQMVKLAKEHPFFLAINKDSLLDKKVDLKVADAYAFVRDSQEKFDAVYIDFPMPVDYNTSRLYSREFYAFVAGCLTEQGFMVLDAPGMTSYTKFSREGLQLVEDGKSPWKEYAYTVAAAGFKRVVPYISNLEKENQQARALTSEYIFEQYNPRPEPKQLEQLIDDYIHGFVFDAQEGFIFAQKKQERELSFHDSRVDTYLLNRERFERAFELDYQPIKQIEWQYVNSVMKPTLPKRNFWQIRFPYYVQ